MSTKPAKTIDVDSSMLKALKEGCDGYLPVFDGEELEAEGCLVEVSLRNLRKIIKSGRKVASLTVGANANVLVMFTSGEAYLATGFSVGSLDGRPSKEVLGLAEFAAETLKGKPKDWREHLMALPDDYEGPLDLPRGNGPRLYED